MQQDHVAALAFMPVRYSSPTCCYARVPDDVTVGFLLSMLYQKGGNVTGRVLVCE